MSEKPDFEKTLAEAFGERIKTDDAFCVDLWCALANVDWYHPASGTEFSCSFRCAGGIIAEIRGSGGYMDWYCSGPAAEVSDFIRRSLKKRGWICDPVPTICDEPGCLGYVGSVWRDDKGVSRSTCGVHYRGKLAPA